MTRQITAILKELGCFPLPAHVLSAIEATAETGLDPYLRKTVTRTLVSKLFAEPPADGSASDTTGSSGSRKKAITAILKEIGCFPVPPHVIGGIEAAVEAGMDSYLRKTVTRQLVGKLIVEPPPAPPAPQSAGSAAPGEGAASKKKSVRPATPATV